MAKFVSDLADHPTYTNAMENWISFIYLYGVGGVLFFSVISWSIYKGALNPKKSSDRKLLIAIVSAYVLYFLFQGTWNYIAIGSL